MATCHNSLFSNSEKIKLNRNKAYLWSNFSLNTVYSPALQQTICYESSEDIPITSVKRQTSVPLRSKAIISVICTSLNLGSQLDTDFSFPLEPKAETVVFQELVYEWIKQSDPTGSNTHQRGTAGNFTSLDTNQPFLKLCNLNAWLIQWWN